MKLKIFFITLTCVLAITVSKLIIYNLYQKSNYEQLHYCYENPDYSFENQDSCYCKMYNLLLKRFLIYRVFHNHKPLKLIRESLYTYIVPEIAIQESDAIISYGGTWNLTFENNLSKLYNKQCYIFEDDKYKDKIKLLASENKKFFIKMDKNVKNQSAILEILKYKNYINGITIQINISNSKQIIDAIKTLNLLEKDFVLVSRNFATYHTYMTSKCKYCGYKISKDYILTYINKKYADKKYISLNQDISKPKDYQTKYCDKVEYIQPFDIDWRIIITRYITDFSDLIPNKSSKQQYSKR